MLVDAILFSMNETFEKRHSRRGRRGILPERLLRANLLQVLFTIRSERQLDEHIEYNLLYRWFVGLSMDEPVWAVKDTGSAIDRRTTRHPGYRINLTKRKRVEEVFGWSKMVGGPAKTRFIGLAKVKAQII